MPGGTRTRKDASVEERIRLVCPRCDTVHRVRSITLGKLYRCKRCSAGLETLHPAVLRCGECGLTRQPERIAVSRLMTCDRCISHPLLDVTFPRPPDPAIETRAERVETTSDAPVDRPVHTGMDRNDDTAVTGAASSAPSRSTEPVLASGATIATAEPSRDGSSPDDPDTDTETAALRSGGPEGRSANGPPTSGDAARDESGDPEEAPLAPALREERAFRTLRTMMEEIQAPLLAEIDSARRSVPLWLAGVAILLLLLLTGALYSAMKTWERRAREGQAAPVAAALQEDLRALKIAQARLEQDRMELDAYVRGLETRLEERRRQAETFYEHARAYREMLIAAGFNPDLIPLERSGENQTAPVARDAAADAETTARARGGAPGLSDETGPDLTP